MRGAGWLFYGILAAGCGGRGAPEPPVEPTGSVFVPSEGLEPDLARARAFLAARPVYEQPLADGLVGVEGVDGLSAAACGACHRAIYEEWAVSTHAAAWTDRQFQAEIGKSGNRWLCLNCHTPLMAQHDRWPVGLQDEDVERPLLADNPAFDPALREEGITCVACHLREGAIVGPGLGGEAPHPVVADPAFRGAEVCLRCHQATATYPGKSFVCTFDTGAEWAAGPHAGTPCAGCHMPAVQRPAAEGGPERTVARHWWRGAGIPKVEGVHPPPEANPPGLHLDAEWVEGGLLVRATNARAGHRLPTGDPERFVWIEVQAYDAAGAPVGPPFTHRVGQRWEWWPVARKLDDNRLAPGEVRELAVPLADGAVAARILASSHRMSEEAAAFHHLDGYPRSVLTHELWVRPDP